MGAGTKGSLAHLLCLFYNRARTRNEGPECYFLVRGLYAYLLREAR